MEEHSKVFKTEKSTIRDESSFKHLSGFFEGMRLMDITPARVSEYKTLRRKETGRKKEPIKPATLARELEVLRHALNLAVREWEWLEKSPFEKVRIERVDNRVERWLTPEEEAKLRGFSLPWLKDIIIFALNTGARQDEILSLKWPEVSLEGGTVTFLKIKNKERRTIPINKTLRELLASKRKVRNISGYVFASQAGIKIDARNLLRAFYKVRKAAGLQELRFHDLRHTFATRLVQAGIDLYVVKELLGHKTIVMTMRYAHHYPESLRRGVEVLDGFGYTLVTPGNKKGFEETPKLLISLVAGTGFEPVTFGL
jgi:integrase